MKITEIRITSMRKYIVYTTTLILASTLLVHSSTAQTPAGNNAVSGQPTSELSVTSDAWAWVPARTMRLRAQLSHSAPLASSASEKADMVVKSLQKSLSAIAPTINLVELSRSLSFKSKASAATAVAMETREFGFDVLDSSQLQKVLLQLEALPSLTDLEVTSLVRESGEPISQASKAALKQAQDKAKSLAETAGCHLGALKNVSISQESQGAIYRSLRQRGESSSPTGDEEFKIFATLVFDLSC